MADTNAAVEEARRRALEAMATQGQRGVDALRAGQMQVAATQQQAVDTALAGSIARGAPAGAADDLTAIISQPGDMAQQILAGAAARAQQDQAAMSGATASYFDQVSGAMPVLQAALDREIVQANADYARQQEAQNFQALQRQWAIEDRARQMEEDAAAAAAGAAGGGRYGGYGTETEYENATTAEAQRLQALALADAEATAQHASRRATVARHNPDSFAPPPGHPVPSTRPQTPAVALAVQPTYDENAAIDAGFGGAPVGAPPPAPGPPPAPPRPPQVFAPGPTLPYARLDNRTHQAVTANEAVDTVLDPDRFYEYQRQAAIDILGADEADAYGRFQPPTPEQQEQRLLQDYERQRTADWMAQEQAFLEAFGVRPTSREQVQEWQRGGDPFNNRKPSEPALLPYQAAEAVGVNLPEVQQIEAPLLDETGQPETNNKGEPVVLNVFDETVAEVGGYLEDGVPLTEALTLVRDDMQQSFGKVFQRVLAVVGAMYAGQ